MTSNQEVLAWEERWSRPVGVAAIGAFVFVVASTIVSSQIQGGSGAERLVGVNQDTGSQIISGFLLAIGFILLIAPLYFLFRAARARSDRVRRQLVGVIFVGPAFFAIAAILLGFATVEAAETFVEDKLPALEKAHVKLDSDKAKEEYEDAFSSASLSSIGAGLQFAGLIGFIAGFLYSALWAMRVGLLTRFWGSLGVALAAVTIFAVASPLFFLFAMLWFVYLGFLFLGWVPGGRPPAWGSGQAEPWPTPGEKAAAELGAGADPGTPGREAEGTPDDSPEPSEGGTPPKKRKQRG